MIRLSSSQVLSQYDHLVYRFRDYTLNVDRGSLTRGDDAIPLRPKSFGVLCYLVENAGRLVSKNELMKSIWHGVVVTDDSLTQCLVEIRKVLGDPDREIIKTVPRRGYLFDEAVEKTASDPAPGTRASAPSGKRRLSMLTLSFITVAAIFTWLIQVDTNDSLIHSQPAPTSVAVLPFADMSPDQDQGYFADGIAEAVLNELVRTPGLIVMARTSSFAFRDVNESATAIADSLNVANLLEGSVRKEGDRVRITAQLIDGASGAHLWSQTYDRWLGNALEVQSDIAGDVAVVLGQKLAGAGALQRKARGAPPRYSEAREHYLKGRFFFNRRSRGDTELAHDHFRAAVEMDPSQPDHWLGMAGTTGALAWRGVIDWQEGLDIRKMALDKALALDPLNAEAYIRLAQIHFQTGNRDLTEAYLERALELGQGSPLVLSIAAGIAYIERQFEEAVELQARAVKLDPLGFVNRGNLASYLFTNGRLEEAAIEYANAGELNPAHAHAFVVELAKIRILQDRLDEAERLVLELPPGAPRARGLVYAYLAQGRFEEAKAALENLMAYDNSLYAVELTDIHAFRGSLDESFHWLGVATESAFDSGNAPANQEMLLRLQTSPFLRPLHEDPRWAEWLQDTQRRIGGSQT